MWELRRALKTGDPVGSEVIGVWKVPPNTTLLWLSERHSTEHYFITKQEPKYPKTK